MLAYLSMGTDQMVCNNQRLSTRAKVFYPASYQWSVITRDCTQIIIGLACVALQGFSMHAKVFYPASYQWSVITRDCTQIIIGLACVALQGFSMRARVICNNIMNKRISFYSFTFRRKVYRTLYFI